MRRHGWILVSVVLVVFACLAALTQFFDKDASRRYGTLSILQFAGKVNSLAAMTNLVDIDTASDPFYGACRRLDLALPPTARVYMDDMLGLTNLDRGLLYHYVTYFLFPREIATSLDQPALITRDGFVGKAAESREDLVAHGFDVELAASASSIKGRPLRNDLNLRPPVSPAWFPSEEDVVIAFLLPLMTALAGLGLLRGLFPTLHPRLEILEQLACGLGLGMMAVAGLTVGVKLCGFHGHGLALAATGVGALISSWCCREDILGGILPGLKWAVRSPAALVGALVFLLLFRAAGVVGLVESDAVAAWMLKAKILHLYAGGEVIKWSSEARLAHAHFDYPPLVPALHSATFDSIGHINECVTKFWPVWMLLLLVGALAALNRGEKSRGPGPSCFLLTLVLLPASRLYVMSEGGAMPMTFFTVLGLAECALAQVRLDRARLGLGLAMLFGAAMTKFEGAIILLAAGAWTYAAMRPSLKPSPGLWRLVAFCLAAAFPFLCLRLQIPALFYESRWVSHALHHPATTLCSMPPFLLVMITRWFVNPGLATWSAEGDHFRWAGKWEGFSSLYYHPTLGLAWIALVLTLALWFCQPTCRKIIGWLLAVMGTTMAGYSFVFASFVSTYPLDRMLGYYTQEIAAPRYLFPVLVAWSVIALTLLFTGPSAPASALPKDEPGTPLAAEGDGL